jgi:hypothetical protein
MSGGTSDAALEYGKNDVYLQNMTVNLNPNDIHRYYFGRTISVGSDVTTKKTNGNVVFNSSSDIILDAINGVLLKDNVEIQVGCTFEIK